MSTRDLAKKLIPACIGLIVLLVIIVLVYFPPFGKLVCTLSSAPGDPHAEYTYTAYFKLWKVNKIVTEQVITSKNEKLLKKFEEQEQDINKEYKSLDFFERKISLEGKHLTSVTTIDYDRIDYKKMAAIGDKVSGKEKTLRIGAAKKMYQESGATCKYK